MADEDATTRIAGVFGRAAATYDTVIPFFAHFGRRLVEVAELQPGERVLDVGAGRGASAFPAAERVGDEGRVVAIDLSPEMVELINQEAARRGTTNLTANVANAHDFAFEEPFDVIVSGSVLHLVPDPAAATHSMHGALRSEGRCVVSHPTGGGEEWNFFGEVIKEFADRAARPLDRPPESPPDLLAVLEEAGFEDIEAHEEVGEFLFPDVDAWWRWTWSTGMRGWLEAFDEEVLEEVRREMFRRVGALAGPDGIPLRQTARFITARRT